MGLGLVFLRLLMGEGYNDVFIAIRYREVHHPILRIARYTTNGGRRRARH